MAVGRFGWFDVPNPAGGNDWYVSVDGVDTEQVIGGTAYYQRTAAWKTVPIDVVVYQGRKWLHIFVTQDAVPAGVNLNFYMVFNMVGGGTLRAPETGSVDIRVYQ